MQKKPNKIRGDNKVDKSQISIEEYAKSLKPENVPQPTYVKGECHCKCAGCDQGYHCHKESRGCGL